MPRKVIGILGGKSSIATADLFRRIVDLDLSSEYQDSLRIIVDNNPELTDCSRAIMRGREDPLPILREAITNLKSSGADFIVVPEVCAHHYLRQISNEVRIPMLNVVQEIVEALKVRYPQINRVGLLATTATLKAELFQKVCQELDIKLIFPSRKVHKELIMKAIEGIRAKGKSFALLEGKEALKKACVYLREKGAEAIIAGCAELSLALSASDIDLPLISSNRVLAQVALEFARSSAPPVRKRERVAEVLDKMGKKIEAKPNLAIVLTGAYGQDNVPAEMFKWEKLFLAAGYETLLLTGEKLQTDIDNLALPELSFKNSKVGKIYFAAFNRQLNERDENRLLSAIDDRARKLKHSLIDIIKDMDIEIICVENALSLPLNLPLGMALWELIIELDLPTIARHHNFYWENKYFEDSNVERLLNVAFPPDTPSIEHVTVSLEAKRSLKERRGIESTYIPNAMDFSSPPTLDDYNRDFRNSLSIQEGEIVIIQPTVISGELGIENSIPLLARLKRNYDLDIVLIIGEILNDEDKRYVKFVEDLAKGEGLRAIIASQYISPERRLERGKKVYTLTDAYVNSDLIIFPNGDLVSFKHILQGILARKPLLVAQGKALDEAMGHQLSLIALGEEIGRVERKIREVLAKKEKREGVVSNNFQMAYQYFSEERVQEKLASLLEKLKSMVRRTA